VSDPSTPTGSEPTLSDATPPGGPAFGTSSRPLPPDAPTWSDGPPTLAGAPPPGADPTTIYPAAPPTAPPVAPPPLPPAGGGVGGGVGGPTAPRAPVAPARRGGHGRTAVGIILLFVAGLSATGTVAAAWTRSQIRDEDTWAATSEALVKDPVVQQAVADQLATTVIDVTGADDVIRGLLPGPLGGLAAPVTGKATEVVSAAALQLVRTDAFVGAWKAAVRSSHQELLAALDGKGRFTDITANGVELDLGSTLEQFRLLLDDKGLTLLDGVDLSGIDVSYLLIDAPGIQRLSDLLDVLDGLVVVLPIVGGVTAVVGLLVARRRSWALAAGGLGLLAGVALMWLVAQVGRDRAAEEFTGGILGPVAVDAVADHVVASLGSALLVVAVVGVAVAVVGAGAALATGRRTV
jgi:hypothetical protein